MYVYLSIGVKPAQAGVPRVARRQCRPACRFCFRFVQSDPERFLNSCKCPTFRYRSPCMTVTSRPVYHHTQNHLLGIWRIAPETYRPCRVRYNIKPRMAHHHLRVEYVWRIQDTSNILVLDRDHPERHLKSALLSVRP